MPHTAICSMIAAALAVQGGCRSSTRGDGMEAQPPTKKVTIARAPFGRMADGTRVELFTLTNPGGVEIRTIPYGAIIVSVRVPDRSGRLDDIVLGFDTFDEYLTKKPPYFGAVVGRYANRIAKGRFVLDGRTYQLATNNGPNHRHGGVRGFDKVVWD